MILDPAPTKGKGPGSASTVAIGKNPMNLDFDRGMQPLPTLGRNAEKKYCSFSLFPPSSLLSVNPKV